MKLRDLKRYFIVTIVIIFVISIPKMARLYYPLNYTQYIKEYSDKYALSPYLVAAIIKAESNFKPTVKSSKNAYGLMQITPSTAEWAAKEMKIDNYSDDFLLDPEFNISMGCWYIDNLKKEFDGNIDLVLAAYNGGRGNVQKWLADSAHSKDGKNLHYIPFKETDKYVKRVKVNYNIYKLLYGDNYKF